LDIRFSNICNFKCRICGPWSSSQWHNDALALGMKQPGKKAIDKSILQPEAFWPQIEELVPGLEEIYFAGGEPLMMEEHYHFLEMLHQQQKFDLTLKYNTNLSVLKLKSWDVIELWRPFKQVIIAASLDGSGRRGEYQRKNQNWEEVLAIRDQLGKEVPNLLFLVSPTVNIFNVLHLPDFHREWVSLGYLGPFDLIPSILRQPAHYAIGILPATIKRKAQAHIAAHLEWLSAQPAKELAQKEFAMNQWRGISNRLVGEGNAAQLREFKSRTQKLDQLRGEKFVEIFPELASLLD
ncbi:MAG TPA: radical SAM protein, partial [Bacteroidetes bacterium]|nr:radical SAM protein [Bacteroidota bacterium]